MTGEATDFWTETDAAKNRRLTSLMEDEMAKTGSEIITGFTAEAQQHLYGIPTKPIIPCSSVLSYRGYGGGNVDVEIVIGVAMRVFQHSTLMHDNLSGGSRTGRGKTFHDHFAAGRDESFGCNVTLFYGDALFAMSAQMLEDALKSTRHGLTCLNILMQGYREVNESRILELFFGFHPPTLDEYAQFMDRRVAAFMRTAIVTGGVAANASGQDIHHFREMATNLGCAQETFDDLNHAFGSSERGDININHAKKTRYIVHALQATGGKAAGELSDALYGGRAGIQDTESVLQMVIDCGAFDATVEEIREFADSSIRALHKTKLNREFVEIFEGYLEDIKARLRELEDSRTG